MPDTPRGEKLRGGLFGRAKRALGGRQNKLNEEINKATGGNRRSHSNNNSNKRNGRKKR